VVFSSATFLFVFLPLVLALYIVVPKRFRNLLLIAASLGFYAWAAGGFGATLAASALADWVLALTIGGALAAGRRDRAGVWLTCSIVLNLGLLAWFKWWSAGVALREMVLRAEAPPGAVLLADGLVPLDTLG